MLGSPGTAHLHYSQHTVTWQPCTSCEASTPNAFMQLCTCTSSLMGDMGDFGDRSHLESARISEHGAAPPREAVQAAQGSHSGGPRLALQVVRVPQHQLTAGRRYLLICQRLHRACGGDTPCPRTTGSVPAQLRATMQP